MPKFEDVIKSIENNSCGNTLNLSSYKRGDGGRIDYAHNDKNKIGDAQIRTLVEKLKNNTIVQRLDLSYNKIGNEGAKALAEMLKTNKTLKELSLSVNQIGDVGATALAEALKTNATLLQLGLGRNEVGDAGTKALAEMLKTNTMLQSLDLPDNQKIGIDGAKALAEGLKSNKTLQYLNLGAIKIRDAGTQAFVEMFKVNKKLLGLSLYQGTDFAINPIHQGAIREAMARNQELAKLTPSNPTEVDDPMLAMYRELGEQFDRIDKKIRSKIKEEEDDANKKFVDGMYEVLKIVANTKPAAFNTCDDKELSNSITFNNDNELSKSTGILPNNFVHPDNKDFREELRGVIESIKEWKLKPNYNFPFAPEREITSTGLKYVHIAAWYGDIEAVKLLKGQGSTLNISKGGYTLLHCAAKNGQEQMVKYLLELELPFSIDAVTLDTCETALHIAASGGHLTTVQSLVNADANFRLKNIDGYTPALLASEKNHTATSNWLKEQEMLLYVREDNVIGVDSLAKELRLNLTENNVPLFLIAVRRNSKNVVKYLVKHSPEENIKALDPEGNTAIHIAAKFGFVNLLEDGYLFPMLTYSEVNTKNQQTPLHAALLAGQGASVQYIIKESPKFDELDKKATVLINEVPLTLSPIELMIALGDEQSLLALLDSKIGKEYYKRRPFKADERLGTLIHIAVRFNQKDILKLLVNKYNQYFQKATDTPLIEIQDLSGATPLNLAAKLGNIDMVQHLYDTYNAQLLTKDEKGNTPAHWFALLGNLEGIRTLCRLAGNREVIDGRDVNGKHPYQVTRDSAVETLIKHLYEKHCHLSSNKEPSWLRRFENLVFQGGGPKGLAYIGARREFDKRFPGAWKYVKRLTGASAGAITATLLAFNASADDLKRILLKTNLLKFVDNRKFELPKNEFEIAALLKDLYRLYTKTTGLTSNEVMRNWIEEQIKELAGAHYKKNMTFGDLAKLVQLDNEKYKHLHIPVTHINHESGFGKTEIFSSEDSNSDDYIISNICALSASIPLVFKADHALKRNEQHEAVKASETKLYADAGLIENYPISYFDRPEFQPEYRDAIAHYNSKTLGFSLVSEKDLNRLNGNYNSSQKLETGVDILKYTLSTIYNNELVRFREADMDRTIFIDTLNVGLTDFSIDDKRQNELIESPVKGFDRYCEQHENFCSIRGTEAAVENDTVNPKERGYFEWFWSWMPSFGLPGANAMPLDQSKSIIMDDRFMNNTHELARDTISLVNGTSFQALHSAEIMTNESAQSSPKKSEVPPKSAQSLNESTFLQQQSFNDKLIISQYLIHYAQKYSPFTLPRNKINLLTVQETNQLMEQQKTLKILQRELDAKKMKRAYKYGVNIGKYADVEYLLGKTENSIHQMLTNKEASRILLKEVETHIQRLQQWIPELTNRKLEKDLRRQEIQNGRLQRRGATVMSDQWIVGPVDGQSRQQALFLNQFQLMSQLNTSYKTVGDVSVSYLRISGQKK